VQGTLKLGITFKQSFSALFSDFSDEYSVGYLDDRKSSGFTMDQN
jgi:hypothetical protein